GIQLLCNLIKNVCFSVRQLPLAHQLSYKQNFWTPVSSTDHLLCNLPSKMNVRTVVRVTLESSSYCTFTWCRVKFPGSQCQALG
ncbi:MAG: hypothetical protein ACEY3K_05280, partial [Wolbachia sp.]